VVTDLPSHSRLTWFCTCADSYVVFNTRPHTILGDNSIYLNRTAIQVAHHTSTSVLPVYLTCWSRKCITCFSPHVKNFHQVWSSYDYPLHSYSVLAADTLRDLVTLTFNLLTLVSGHTWRVSWSTRPLSLNLLRLSLIELWVLTLVHQTWPWPRTGT